MKQVKLISYTAYLITAIVTSVLIFSASCHKSDCTNAAITIAPQTVTIGSAFTIATDNNPDFTYSWTGPNQYTGSGNSISPFPYLINQVGDNTFNLSATSTVCQSQSVTAVVTGTMPSVPCTVSQNHLDISGFFASCDFTNVSVVDNGSYIAITGLSSGGDLEIDLPSLPKVSGVYQILANVIHGPYLYYQCGFGFTDNGGGFDMGQNGVVYVNIVNNKYSVSFCNLPVLTGAGTAYATGNMLES